MQNAVVTKIVFLIFFEVMQYSHMLDYLASYTNNRTKIIPYLFKPIKETFIICETKAKCMDIVGIIFLPTKTLEII